MAAPRLREPVVQMRETLAVAKTVPVLEARVDAVEALMLARGMKPADAARRLSRALGLAAGEPAWTFDVAWEIGWQTIYWPHRTEERRFERQVLRMCRAEFEKAWYGLPTKLEHLRAALEALDAARDETLADAVGAELVA